MTDPRLLLLDARCTFYRLLWQIAPTESIRQRYLHAVRHANARYWGEPIPESCRYCRSKR